MQYEHKYIKIHTNTCISSITAMVICKVTTQAKRSANFSPWWQHHWCKVPHCFWQTIQLQCEDLVFLTQCYIRLGTRMGYNTWKWRCLSWLVHLKWESKALAIEVDLLCDSPSPIWKGFRSNIGTIPLSTNTKAFPPVAVAVPNPR